MVHECQVMINNQKGSIYSRSDSKFCSTEDWNDFLVWLCAGATRGLEENWKREEEEGEEPAGEGG